MCLNIIFIAINFIASKLTGVILIICTPPFQNEAAIIVDWSNGCTFPYYAQSVVNMELVGRQVAVVLWKLMQGVPESVSPSLVHFVGTLLYIESCLSVLKWTNTATMFFDLVNSKEAVF